ncbi:YkvA family protein [Catenuloplanes sp. NPDC051500]|uniref:YkvA family protein n=1 Tax=Catenuloplanes sp. NPDC051500 TaxID=3363959 RepID=UPI00379506E0
MANNLRRVAAFKALWGAFTASRRGGPSVGQRLAALPRMIKAVVKGEYDGGKSLLLMAGALAYLVSPIDVVPEAFLLLVGLVDDAVMITWLAGSVLSETDRFIEWEKDRDRILIGKPH